MKIFSYFFEVEDKNRRRYRYKWRTYLDLNLTEIKKIVKTAFKGYVLHYVIRSDIFSVPYGMYQDIELNSVWKKLCGVIK